MKKRFRILSIILIILIIPACRNNKEDNSQMLQITDMQNNDNNSFEWNIVNNNELEKKQKDSPIGDLFTTSDKNGIIYSGTASALPANRDELHYEAMDLNKNPDDFMEELQYQTLIHDTILK